MLRASDHIDGERYDPVEGFDPIERFDLVTIGSFLPDLRFEPLAEKVGHKQDGLIHVAFGGSAANTALVGTANRLRTGAIGVQQHGFWADLGRRWAKERGISVMYQERKDGPALSLITPGEDDGQFDIHTQRLAPHSTEDMTEKMIAALETVKAVIVGPMKWTPAAQSFVAALGDLAPDAYRAWIPHPRAISDPAFSGYAEAFHYVQMNAAECRRLLGGGDESEIDRRKLKDVFPDHIEFAVTNGAEQGWLWSDGWKAILPPQVETVNATGCGDAFCGAFTVARGVMGESAADALDYAIRAACGTAAHQGMGDIPAFQPSTVRQSLAENANSKFALSS